MNLAIAPSLSERLLAAGGLAEADRCALVQAAARLRRAARDGSAAPLLAGRHVAIAAAEPSGGDGAAPAEAVFERAARALGARVSRIAPDLLCDDSQADCQSTCHAAARLLPRLYDAVDCHIGSAAHALALQREAGVPVYLALAGESHPIRALMAELEGEDADAVLVSLVQAVLVETLA